MAEDQEKHLLEKKRAQLALEKKRKKAWFQIVAPKLFREQIIGESLVGEAGELKDRCITSNLMALTNDMKGQNINITFRLKEVKNNRAYAEVVGYKMIPTTIRRIVRRGKDKIDDSFVCKTSDGINVRIKILLITRGDTKGSVIRKLRKSSINAICAYAKKTTYENFMSDIVTYRLQRFLRDSVNKIYPLKNCEIRQAKIAGPGEKAIFAEEIKGELKKEDAIEEAEEEKTEDIEQELK